MPTDPQVTELDGTLNRVLELLLRAEDDCIKGYPWDAAETLRNIINLLEAQRAAAPDRPLSWD